MQHPHPQTRRGSGRESRSPPEQISGVAKRPRVLTASLKSWHSSGVEEAPDPQPREGPLALAPPQLRQDQPAVAPPDPSPTGHRPTGHPRAQMCTPQSTPEGAPPRVSCVRRRVRVTPTFLHRAWRRGTTQHRHGPDRYRLAQFASKRSVPGVGGDPVIPPPQEKRQRFQVRPRPRCVSSDGLRMRSVSSRIESGSLAG